MRRRRNRATWFPVDPNFYGENPIGGTWYDDTLTITDPVSVGDSSVSAVQITLDETHPAEGPNVDQFTLADFVQGQDYLLQRVVGKVWMNVASNTASSGLRQAIGCMALAVLPTGSTGTPSLPAEEYNPLFAQNAQQPWIWRRTWILDAVGKWDGASSGNPLGYPNSTAYYGSVADGGHLDSKIRRRIVREHRLFMIAAFSATEAAGEGTGTVNYGFDLRILGQMRRGKNSSSF